MIFTIGWQSICQWQVFEYTLTKVVITTLQVLIENGVSHDLMAENLDNCIC